MLELGGEVLTAGETEFHGYIGYGEGGVREHPFRFIDPGRYLVLFR